MALVYVGGASASGTASSFDVSLTGLTGGAGSAAQAGDLVIVATGFAATSNGNPGVETAGYVEVADLYANASRDSNFAVAYKVLSSAETSVTCSGSGVASNAAATVVHVWRGASASSPMDVAATTAVSSGRVIDNPAITPVTAGAEIVIAGMAVATAAFNSTTAPIGFGNQVYISHDPGTAIGMGIASAAWDGSGAVDPSIWTATGNSASDSFAAVTIAIRPAGASTLSRSAAITGTSSVVASRRLTRSRAASIAAASAVSAAGAVARSRSASSTAASTMTANVRPTRGRAASVLAGSSMSAGHHVSRNRSATMAAESSMAAVASTSRSIARSAGVSSSSAMVAVAVADRSRSAGILAASLITAAVSVTRSRTASIASASAMTVDYDLAGVMYRSGDMLAVSSFAAGYVVDRSTAANMVANSAMIAGRAVIVGRSIAIISASELIAAARVGAVHRRYAFPGDLRGGTVSVSERGGAISNQPRSGVLMRA